MILSSEHKQIPYFKILLNQDTLNDEAVPFSGTSLSMYLTTRHHIVEGRHLAVNNTANVNKAIKYNFVRSILLNFLIVTIPWNYQGSSH